jgi:hypothetical protein
MVKIGGAISPPHDALAMPSTVITEKFEIAAAHQVEAGTDQPDRPVAEVMCLPGGARGHAAFPKQPLRNHAVGFAGKVPIERADSSGREILIEGDDRGRGRRSRSTADEYDGSAVLRAADDPVFAIACGMQEHLRQGPDAARLAKFRGGGREKHDRRSKMRQPDRRGLVRALVRVEREIAVPSG